MNKKEKKVFIIVTVILALVLLVTNLKPFSLIGSENMLRASCLGRLCPIPEVDSSGYVTKHEQFLGQDLTLVATTIQPITGMGGNGGSILLCGQNDGVTVSNSYSIYNNVLKLNSYSDQTSNLKNCQGNGIVSNLTISNKKLKVYCDVHSTGNKAPYRENKCIVQINGERVLFVTHNGDTPLDVNGTLEITIVDESLVEFGVFSSASTIGSASSGRSSMELTFSDINIQDKVTIYRKINNICSALNVNTDEVLPTDYNSLQECESDTKNKFNYELIIGIIFILGIIVFVIYRFKGKRRK